MGVEIGTTVFYGFCLRDPATGNESDADSTPTFKVFEDDSASPLVLTGSTIAKRGSETGEYYVKFTINVADGFEAGKSYNVTARATVAGKTAKKTIASFAVDLPGSTPVVAYGTADSGTTTTMVDAERTEALTDFWKDCYVRFLTGPNANAAPRRVTAFNPATDTITFSPAWPSAVANGHIYSILGLNSAAVAVDTTGLATAAALASVQADTDDIQARIPAALVAGRLDVSVGAMQNNVFTAAAVASGALVAASFNADVGISFADAYFDRANGVETGWTLRQTQRVLLAAAAGKADGFPGPTIHYRDQANLLNRITATVDAFGNRSAVSFNLA